MVTKSKTTTSKSVAKTTKKTNVGNKLVVASFDSLGKQTGSFATSLTETEAKPAMISQLIHVAKQRQRQGTQSTKTRGTVHGSTRKIYRQKGTGRARHGSKKAPIFVGGGITFGPQPRTFSAHIPQKMRRRALQDVLVEKIKQQEVKVVSGLAKFTGKTKPAIELLTKLEVLDQPTLIVLEKNMKLAVRAIRNIEYMKVIPTENLSAMDLLNFPRVIFAEEALKTLQAKLTKKTE